MHLLINLRKYLGGIFIPPLFPPSGITHYARARVNAHAHVYTLRKVCSAIRGLLRISASHFRKSE